MSLPINWTTTARADYASLLKQIEDTYGLETVLEKSEEVIDTIEQFPDGFQKFEHDLNLRRAVISKQTSIIYRIRQTDIQILYFWDNRKGAIE